MTSSPVERRSVNAPSGDAVIIGPLDDTEYEAMFELFTDIVARGEGYPQSPPLTRGMFDATWVSSVSLTVVARWGGAVVGAYYLKPNSPGRAAHIANAGYVVDARYRRRGIGRLLVQDSLWRAPLLGFDAMQFNLVFEGNPARSLYEEFGWREIGRIPDAVEGEDAIIYWRRVG